MALSPVKPCNISQLSPTVARDYCLPLTSQCRALAYYVNHAYILWFGIYIYINHSLKNHTLYFFSLNSICFISFHRYRQIPLHLNLRVFCGISIKSYVYTCTNMYTFVSRNQLACMQARSHLSYVRIIQQEDCYQPMLLNH